MSWPLSKCASSLRQRKFPRGIEATFLGCLCLLATRNDPAVNTGMQVSVQVLALNSFGYMPRGGIAGSNKWLVILCLIV